jgi:hypothetical protein
MNDFSVYLPENAVTARSILQDVDHVHDVRIVPREIMPISTEDEPAKQGELEKGFDETQARREADRCLKCGLICYQHTGIFDKEKIPSSAFIK